MLPKAYWLQTAPSIILCFCLFSVFPTHNSRGIFIPIKYILFLDTQKKKITVNNKTEIPVHLRHLQSLVFIYCWRYARKKCSIIHDDILTFSVRVRRTLDSTEVSYSNLVLFFFYQLVPDPDKNRCKVFIGGCELEKEHKIYVVALPKGKLK